MALAIRSSIPAEVWRDGDERDLVTALELLQDADQPDKPRRRVIAGR